MVMANRDFSQGQITEAFASIGQVPWIIIIMITIVIIAHIFITKRNGNWGGMK